MYKQGARYMYKDNKALFFLCLYILAVSWIYIGTLSFGSEPSSWSGGVAWGPRYLLPVLPFMMIILGSIFLRIKKGYFLRSLVLGKFSGLLRKLDWDSHMVSIRVNVWFDHRRASRSSQLYGPNDLVSLLFSYYPSY